MGRIVPRLQFEDSAAEETGHPRELAEAALAHKVRNRIEAAYRRSNLFERRRVLMGGLSGRRESATGIRSAPLIRRGRPPDRFRDLAFEPASGRSILTAEKWGSVPIGECK